MVVGIAIVVAVLVVLALVSVSNKKKYKRVDEALKDGYQGGSTNKEQDEDNTNENKVERGF